MKNRRRGLWAAGLCFFLLAVLINTGCAASRAPDITTTNKQKRSEIMKAYDQALKGEAEAQKFIGTAYVTGNGVTRNTARARTWLERAAKQGNTAAQYNLYVLLAKEPGASPADAAEAAKWLRAAAESNSMLAQFRLAEIYRRGESGTPRDMKKAAVLYEAAAAQGYVETLYGRRLYLPEINAKNAQRRQYAERTAINAPLQGTAADLIKKAMIEVDAWLHETGEPARMIMQVHDELVFEVPREEAQRLGKLISERMGAIAQLDVPLLAEAGIADNWQLAH